jgi:hypothetical protein
MSLSAQYLRRPSPLDGTEWTKVGGDLVGENADGYSGRSLVMSADGSRLAIGAPINDANGDKSGHVRIYDWNETGAWTQVGVP